MKRPLRRSNGPLMARPPRLSGDFLCLSDGASCPWKPRGKPPLAPPPPFLSSPSGTLPRGCSHASGGGCPCNRYSPASVSSFFPKSNGALRPRTAQPYLVMPAACGAPGGRQIMKSDQGAPSDQFGSGIVVRCTSSSGACAAMKSSPDSSSGHATAPRHIKTCSFA